MTMTQTAPTVKCGNKAAHGGDPGYHFTAGGVRECYASTGRFSGVTHAQVAESAEVVRQAEQALPMAKAWHSTGPAAEQGHWERQCPGASCPVVQMLAAREPMPEVTVDDAVAKMRASLDAREAAEKAAQYARYAAWRSIPVYVGGRAYFALEMGGSTHFFKVSRPEEGAHKGKTFVEEQAGDNFHKMGWVRTGEVLDAIARDPHAAGLLYGQKIERCYRCHRTLTDLDSRTAGIGPDCAKKG